MMLGLFELMLQFDKKGRTIGFVVCSLDRLPESLVAKLIPQWSPIEVIQTGPLTGEETDNNEQEVEGEGKLVVVPSNAVVIRKKSRRKPLLRTPFLLAACDGDLEAMKVLYEENPAVLNDVDVQGSLLP